MDTEINAKPAQAEAGVGAGAELGKNSGEYFDEHIDEYSPPPAKICRAIPACLGGLGVGSVRM